MNEERILQAMTDISEEYIREADPDLMRAAPRKRRPLRVALIAAVISALAMTLTAVAVSGGTNILNLLLGAFSHGDTDDVPDQNVLQAQLDEGQWVYLNDENIAVILPESPVKIMISRDGGTTWNESIVCGSDKMETYGAMRDHFQYSGGFIGFFGESGGYLVLTGGVSMNNQPMRIYLTEDGGDTWSEIGDPYSKGAHISVLTGAGFSTPEIGFIAYRYYEDAGPDIWRTTDGGDTWEKLPVTLPEPYASGEYHFTPRSPTFDGKNGSFPIVAIHSGTEDTIYMYSNDYGLTWAFEQSGKEGRRFYGSMG